MYEEGEFEGDWVYEDEGGELGEGECWEYEDGGGEGDEGYDGGAGDDGGGDCWGAGDDGGGWLLGWWKRRLEKETHQ